MQLPYRMEIYRDGDYWAAEFPELPGLVAGHEEWEGLQAAILDAKRAYFEAALESGYTIPEPKADNVKAYSGRILVRMPKSLHHHIVETARHEGVSVNQFVVATLAREIGRVETIAGIKSTSHRLEGVRGVPHDPVHRGLYTLFMVGFGSVDAHTVIDVPAETEQKTLSTHALLKAGGV